MRTRARRGLAGRDPMPVEVSIAIAKDPTAFEEMLISWDDSRIAAVEVEERAKVRVAAAEAAEAKSTGTLQALEERARGLDDREAVIVADETSMAERARALHQRVADLDEREAVIADREKSIDDRQASALKAIQEMVA